MTQKLDEIVVTETKVREAKQKNNVVDVSEVDPPVVCERPAYLPKEEPKQEEKPTVVVANKVVINE